MLCFLFDVFSLEVKSRPKMRWITKEELQRDLNELLPDKDVCDLILLELLHWHLPLSTHMIRSIQEDMFTKGIPKAFCTCMLSKDILSN